MRMLFSLDDLPVMSPPVPEQQTTRVRRKRKRRPKQLCLLDLLALKMPTQNLQQ